MTRFRLPNDFEDRESRALVEVVPVPKGETVFKEGDKADLFYIVASGVVRTYTVSNDGRRIIDNFHFADDILGLNAGAQHRFYAASVCDSVVAGIRRSDLDKVIGCDKELGRRVQSSLLVSLGRAQDHAVLMGLSTAREKIEAFLGAMAERASRSGTPKLQLRQSDIADYLGLSRETVSRVLSTLNATELATLGIRGHGHGSLAQSTPNSSRAARTLPLSMWCTLAIATSP